MSKRAITPPPPGTPYTGSRWFVCSGTANIGDLLFPSGDSKVSSTPGTDTDSHTGYVAAEAGTDGTSLLAVPLIRTSGALVALGTNQGNAAPVLLHINFVSASDGTKGVALPITAATNVGLELTIINTVAASALKVYPATGGQIDALGANVALSVAGGKTAILRVTAANQWFSQVGA